MTTFAECDATFISHRADSKIAGSFTYSDEDGDGKPSYMFYSCPCGCGSIGALQLHGPHAAKAKDEHPYWEWDGNREKPTLTPSIRHSTYVNGVNVEHWHGYLRSGRFVSV